jgi:hypothetical protein
MQHQGWRQAYPNSFTAPSRVQTPAVDTSAQSQPTDLFTHAFNFVDKL